MRSDSKQHSVQDDFALARRGIQGFRDPLNPSAALNALQRIEEQNEILTNNAAYLAEKITGLHEQLEVYATTLRQIEGMKPDRMTREDFAEALGIARNLAWKALNPVSLSSDAERQDNGEVPCPAKERP